MRDDPPVTDLVTRARNGDKQAWDALVERYAPLIWSICRRHRLDHADAADVGQSVWLRLVDQLAAIRDPAALPGWLATTTQRECCRVLRAGRQPHAGGQVLDAENTPDGQTGMAEQELLVAERNTALREAFAHLPPCCQRLIGMLIGDPSVPYAEISTTLGIPVGSIGPTRGRCLDKLRRHPAIAALINAETASTGADIHASQWCKDDGQQMAAPGDGLRDTRLARYPATCQEPQRLRPRCLARRRSGNTRVAGSGIFAVTGCAGSGQDHHASPPAIARCPAIGNRLRGTRRTSHSVRPGLAELTIAC
jgi:RNA polymerase sigma factor (sigma-70 family)